MKRHCRGCEYIRRIGSAGEEWTFMGCIHPPNEGKWIAEIEKCPKEQQGDERICMEQEAKQ